MYNIEEQIKERGCYIGCDTDLVEVKNNGEQLKIIHRRLLHCPESEQFSLPVHREKDVCTELMASTVFYRGATNIVYGTTQDGCRGGDRHVISNI